MQLVQEESVRQTIGSQGMDARPQRLSRPLATKTDPKVDLLIHAKKLREARSF